MIEKLFYGQQFEESEPLKLNPDLFEPLEGFTGEHVEPLSVLVQRLNAGQFVDVYPEGDSVETQFFNHMPENFEVLDTYEELSGQAMQKQRAGKVIPNSGVAAPEAPQGNSGADNAGD